MSYEKIKMYYDKKWWGIAWVRQAVEHGHISAEQFEQITGQKY